MIQVTQPTGFDRSEIHNLHKNKSLIILLQHFIDQRSTQGSTNGETCLPYLFKDLYEDRGDYSNFSQLSFHSLIFKMKIFLFGVSYSR